MMKKLLLALLATLSLTLASCGKNDTPTSNESNKEVSYKGQGEFVWHIDTKFTCIAEVTFENDLIKNVKIIDEDSIHTDAFDGWSRWGKDYLKQFEGKSAKDVSELVCTDPKDVKDHHDCGTITGVIDAMSGATASSNVIARAVKDACLKYIKNK